MSRKLKGIIGYKGAGPIERVQREIRREDRRRGAEARMSKAEERKAAAVEKGIPNFFAMMERAEKVHDAGRKSS